MFFGGSGISVGGAKKSIFDFGFEWYIADIYWTMDAFALKIHLNSASALSMRSRVKLRAISLAMENKSSVLVAATLDVTLPKLACGVDPNALLGIPG